MRAHVYLSRSSRQHVLFSPRCSVRPSAVHTNGDRRVPHRLEVFAPYKGSRDRKAADLGPHRRYQRRDGPSACHAEDASGCKELVEPAWQLGAPLSAQRRPTRLLKPPARSWGTAVAGRVHMSDDRCQRHGQSPECAKIIVPMHAIGTRCQAVPSQTTLARAEGRSAPPFRPATWVDELSRLKTCELGRLSRIPLSGTTSPASAVNGVPAICRSSSVTRTILSRIRRQSQRWPRWSMAALSRIPLPVRKPRHQKVRGRVGRRASLAD